MAAQGIARHPSLVTIVAHWLLSGKLSRVSFRMQQTDPWRGGNRAGSGNIPLISRTLHIFVLQKKAMSIG
jgi:hypothetical protein